ncbi:hypothetical protein L2E82_44784 [Cichorium intybus]|uniref:Uncharacterized protein n=1 Tax=Cichorium intybus TaxID=13427 RepID=A0ACB8ZS61_CICIN|nr:hypothetical protein L2E82_44784 [Cichorium intybus]
MMPKNIGVNSREGIANLTEGTKKCLQLEQQGEAAGVGALPDVSAAEKHPLHISSISTLIRSQQRKPYSLALSAIRLFVSPSIDMSFSYNDPVKVTGSRAGTTQIEVEGHGCVLSFLVHINPH